MIDPSFAFQSDREGITVRIQNAGVDGDGEPRKYGMLLSRTGSLFRILCRNTIVEAHEDNIVEVVENDVASQKMRSYFEKMYGTVLGFFPNHSLGKIWEAYQTGKFQTGVIIFCRDRQANCTRVTFIDTRRAFTETVSAEMVERYRSNDRYLTI